MYQYIINFDTSGTSFNLKNPPINYCRVTAVSVPSFNGFLTQANVIICLVIGSRKPSGQLALNVCMNVMPIYTALSKFKSCNDIIYW